ncbi:nucleoside recognition domain-containing protein [Candidatus Arthromitus sp. SFB-turkey]|uniref:nucleoside recognition domain-containing protein n=1 Tax=Candidatus Arthromitus sp. SFB-turkey TaxID=1840217 RepID=UPI0007F49844|nr:nucleoside recognition domain-containing protein [Candidatus Arthromitus sp. SFB-turkey]OAT87496.1 spore maturation protein [Candidatus Arthromitus sp. SFB-turkey]
MINYIWFFMIGSGLIVSLINGSGEKITKAITDSTSSTVTFVISLVGIMCLWCGIMKIAEESGLTNKISKILKPILKILFKEKNNEKVMGPVVMNLTANILGLGNAATPFGIKAMEELDVVNEKKGIASNDMALFLVLNANCIQLFPTTILSIRAIEGSSNHGVVMFGIITTTFLTSIISVIICKILQRIF